MTLSGTDVRKAAAHLASRGEQSAQRGSLTATLAHPLVLLLLFAAAIRLPLAFWPNIIHPDETFQYLEPAWRLLGHDGIVSWEWRYGMRPFLLPALFAGPIALSDWIAPGGTGAFVAARIVAALASLSLVASAWALGARMSRTHATVAAFVAAIWFEFVAFAPHTLSEPLATAIILPAALLLTNASAESRHLALGGALLALACVVRFQYAPAIAVLALGAGWGRWRNLGPMIAGGAVALALAGLADAANGRVPLAWLAANIEQNFVNDRAAVFGEMSAITYLLSFWMMWSVAIVPLAFAIYRGWRRAPLLFAVAIVNIAFHGAIPHKEYRFIFLSVALLVLIAALGSADWIEKLNGRRRLALPLVMGAWALASAVLAATGTMAQYWTNGIGASRLAATLRGDPRLCGLALYKTYFPSLPGQQRLVGAWPLYGFDPDDPRANGDLAAAVKNSAPAFNRIVAPKDAAAELPASFSPRACETVGDGERCVFARGGACDAAAAAGFAFNDVLSRVDR